MCSRSNFFASSIFTDPVASREVGHPAYAPSLSFSSCSLVNFPSYRSPSPTTPITQHHHNARTKRAMPSEGIRQPLSTRNSRSMLQRSCLFLHMHTTEQALQPTADTLLHFSPRLSVQSLASRPLHHLANSLTSVKSFRTPLYAKLNTWLPKIGPISHPAANIPSVLNPISIIGSKPPSCSDNTES